MVFELLDIYLFKSSVSEQEQRAYKFRSLLKDSNRNITMISWKFVEIKHLLIPRLEDGLNYSDREETALKMSLGLVGINLQPVNPQLSYLVNFFEMTLAALLKRFLSSIRISQYLPHSEGRSRSKEGLR